MALHSRHLLLLAFLISITSFVACYRTKMQEDPLESTYVDDLPYIDDGSWTFKGLFRQSTDDVLSLKRFEKFDDTSHSRKIINVNDYGAGGGDGHSDDTEAFEKAWETACSSGEAVLVVPEGNYLLKPIRFSGPCKSDIEVQIHGKLDASDDPSDYSKDTRHWLKFDSVKKLSVHGGGTINGNGDIWWENSCKRNKSMPCKDAPTALTFLDCESLIVEELSMVNAQQIHVSFQDSMNINVSGLTVTAPRSSPNTDGIHVTNSQNMQISNSVIGTGDDCISIVSGSRNILATNITCGPGHGISIGSLGAGKSKAFVSGVTVKGAKLSGTTNGVRIKTWQGGSGLASNIQFMHIEMKNKSAVQISNVLYQDISGTSASDVAVKFDCSDTFPCQNIVLEDIYLQREGGGDADASCHNVKLSYFGKVSPSCCS